MTESSAATIAAKLNANVQFTENIQQATEAGEKLKASPINLMKAILAFYGQVPDENGKVSIPEELQTDFPNPA
jgi:hypothetical protein